MSLSAKSEPEQLITQNLDIWTAAIQNKSTTGRGSNKKQELYGIKKLRELILELAVRGLLVPQDPNDEPASVLLEKIATEKAHLVKEGKLKKQKKLPGVNEDEEPFKLPKGWSWSRLAELCVLENGDRSKNYPNKSLLVDEGVPFVNAGHLSDGRVNEDEMTFITQERFDLLKAGKFSIGDILFCLRGSLGKSAIVDSIETGAIASSLVIVRLIGDISREFIHEYFNSPLSYRQILLYDNGTAQPNLSAAHLGKFLVPVPPEAEQPRIVAKVDELMALCDQLEQQTETSLNAHQTLVETLLKALLNAAQSRDDTSAFKQAWQRIVDHFDVLFTTEHSIDQLKQTILQLAVMGKLVPQDSNDEPASVLLEKIAAEKERLVKEGKIKKQKKLPPISDEEKPFELPEGWEWARLSDIGIGFTGKTPSTKNAEFFDGDIPFIGPGQITPEGHLLTADKFLSQSGLEHSVEAVPGDILMVCIGGSIGKSVVSDKRIAFNQQINSLRALKISSRYLHIALKTDTFYNSVLEKASGSATPIINRSKWEELLVPVCPETEQPRIVAKVDSLMNICLKLRQSISLTNATRFHLANAMAETALK